MSKKISKKSIVIIVAIVAVIAVLGSSLAWFITQTTKTQNFSISGINASATVYFQTGKNATVNAKKYMDKDGLYVLSLNKDDDNYIGKLRVTVSRSGAKCCLRVRMGLEWQLADGTVAQYSTNVPYIFYDKWYDNRSVDYCVYYQGDDLSGKATYDDRSLIKGFDESKFDVSGFEDGVTVKALIEVDAVQFNRYPQLWNIDKLPWK